MDGGKQRNDERSMALPVERLRGRGRGQQEQESRGRHGSAFTRCVRNIHGQSGASVPLTQTITIFFTLDLFEC